MFKQRRKFEVGMEVDQSRHEDRILQMDHAMAVKSIYYLVFSADRQNGPLIDRNCAIIN